MPSWRATNGGANLFSSGGLFNYSAFSLQITREHSGVQPSKESGAERVMKASVEFPWWISSRGSWANFQEEDIVRCSVTLPLCLPLDPSHAHRFVPTPPPGSLERWDRIGERVCGGWDGIRWKGVVIEWDEEKLAQGSGGVLGRDQSRQRESTAAVIYAAIMSGGAGSQGSMMGKTER